MYDPVDRRTALTAIATLLAMTGRSRAAEPLAAVLDPPGGPPMACAGAIARRGDGSVTLRAAAGVAGASAFTLERPFRVASISKMVAASVFLAKAGPKGVDLDGDASGLLGFRLRHPAHPDVPISTRMLLSHTSGLRNGPSYPVPLGHRLAEAFKPGGRHYDDGAWFGPREHWPGAWFAYADVNFALVAQMLERLSGERFDLRMRRALFRPLGLDIGYNWSGVSQAKRDLGLRRGLHRIDGQWVPQVDATVPPYPTLPFTRPADAPGLTAADYKVGENGFAFSPQGGLRLSLADMDRLARLFASHGQGLIPKAALEAMQQRTWTYDPARPNGDTDSGFLQGYGLGCEAPLGRPGPSGDAFFGPDSADWRGHFGDAYGWITGLFWNRRDGRTLVYAVGGMPETDRPQARASSFTTPEEILVAAALGT